MRRKLCWVVLVLLLLAIPVVGACAPKAAPPGEGEKAEIIIGYLEGMTGPLAGTAIPYVDGGQDAIRYINEEKGGVLGYKIKPTIIDFKMDAAAAFAGWDRFRSEGAPVVMAQTAATAALWEMPNRDFIPMVVGGGASVDAVFPKEPSYLFAVTPVLLRLFNSWVNVVADDWAASGKPGSPKVGYDFASIGTMPTMFTKNVKMLMDERGWEYVITRSSIAAADATTQVLQMKNLGCDYVYLYNTETTIIVFVRELDRQNFSPKITGTSALASEETWRAVGDLVVGASMPQFSVQWTETDVPGVKLLHELNQKWHPNVKSRSSHYCRGFAELLVVAKGLEMAVENVGYENLTGDAVKQSLETIKDYDPMEMGMGYTWTPTDHQGLHGCRWYQWTKDGLLTPITDWDILPPIPEGQRTDAYWMQ